MYGAVIFLAFVCIYLTIGVSALKVQRVVGFLSKKLNGLIVNARPGAEYRDMMAQAIESRGGNAYRRESAQENEEILPKPWVRDEDVMRVKSPREMMDFKTKIPFDDEIYTNIRLLIDIITNRIETNQPISVEDAERFEEAVEEVIRDSKMYLPPPKPARPIYPGTDNQQPIPKSE